LRFACLGSGSRGNGVLIEQGGTCLLVDCGFSLKETQFRLGRLGRSPEQLTGLLVTHEHSDHIRGVGLLARRFRLPVWITSAAVAEYADGPLPDLRLFNNHEPFEIDELQIQPFPVPHDAREPTQFVFGDGARRVGMLTDTGEQTEYIEKMLTSCDALLLECNHDPDMLAGGSYPPMLKRRISGRFGHLSNEQAAALLRALDHSRLQHLAAVHLSEKNNTPALARRALSETLDCTPDWIGVADQDSGLDWRQIV